MAVDQDTQWRLHKGCIHDVDVQTALAGFLVARFALYHIEVDPEILSDSLADFAKAMSDPDMLRKAAGIINAKHERRRKGMH